MYGHFEDLPKEVLIEIASRINPKDLFHLCAASRYLNLSLNGDDYFWRTKFRHDFGEPAIIFRPTWKEMYRNVFTTRVYVFGLNERGQLGIGKTHKREITYPSVSPREVLIPTELPSVKAISVSAGGQHSMLLDHRGNVFTFGNNAYGQLGHATGEICTQKLIMVPEVKGARAISAGSFHSMVIGPDHSVWVFGRNDKGQLGLRRSEQIDESDWVVSEESLSLRRDRPHDLMTLSKPMRIPNLRAKVVSAGGRHSVLIDLDRFTVWTFGDNTFGQLGVGDPFATEVWNSDIPQPIPGITAVDVSAGGYHTLILDTEGNVWAFGNNDHGQLGLGDTIIRYIPVKVPNLKAIKISAGYDFSLVIDTEHRLLLFRNGITVIPNLRASDISVGIHSIVVTTDNRVYTFGRNDYGQLGIGDTLSRDPPVLIDGIRVTPISMFKMISAGYHHSLVISTK